MKTFTKFFYSALMLWAFFGCKKNIAAENINDTSIADIMIDSFFYKEKLGRQHIIELETGNHTYPTSKALLWLPKHYKDSVKAGVTFPLIFNLYGQGQDGTDLNQLLVDSTMSQFIANGFDPVATNKTDNKTYQFIVCSPQCPATWGWSAPQVKHMIADLKKNLAIDRGRMYLTGFSAGGWGLWSCITEDTGLAKQFAAIVPISSAAADHPEKITNVDKFGIACLNICGDQDAFYSLAVKYTDTINANNPPIPAVLNTLHKVGHTAWIYAYNPNWNKQEKMNIYDWMIQYRKK